MTTVCKNCNHHFEGHFCNRCGQSADTHKLNMHFIWHDLQHGLFHFDNGIFYTIKQLLTRPGHAIREFVDGKRVNHFKPATFVVFLATLYAFLYHYFIHNLFDVKSIHPRENIISANEKVTGWITDHLAVSALILILNNTIASYLVFKKRGYNFAEHLVLNTFFIGLVLVVSLLLFPVLYLFGTTETLRSYTLMIQFINFVLMYWCYAEFFNKIPLLKTLGLTLLTWLIISFINLVMGYVVGWIVNSSL